MAEDFDVEAMLEAPYKKNDEHSSSKHRSDKHSDRHRHSDRSKDSSKRSGTIMSHQLVGRRPIKLTTIINPEGEEVEVERREDPEEKALADKIVSLFIEAGYFQINHEISLFHKITRGMIWCLQSANYGFDTDSFAGFDEQTNIRNKIFLSEKIIRVLLSKAVKCPHLVQPHQILGLNVEHLFPLIKWLVNHCLQLQKAHKDDFQRIASQYLDTKQFASTLLEIVDVKYSSIWSVLDTYGPLRNCIWNYPRKLKQNVKYCKGEFVNVVYKNIEKVPKQRRSSELLIEVNTAKPESCIEFLNKKSRINHYKNLNDELFGNYVVPEIKDTDASENNLFANLIKSNKKPKVENKTVVKPILKDNTDILQYQKIDNMINTLVSLEDNYKKVIQTESAKLKISPNRSHPDNKNKLTLDELKAMDQKLDEEFQNLNNEFSVHYKEDWTKGPEKQIYRERLNELQSQIILTTVQTKQHYAHYNTLIDIQAYKNKEINLLNSVIENYEVAKLSKNNQDQYLQQLENVADWIKQTKSKLSVKHVDAKSKRADMHKQWSNLMQIERDYAKVTRDIKLAVAQAMHKTKHNISVSKSREKRKSRDRSRSRRQSKDRDDKHREKDRDRGERGDRDRGDRGQDEKRNRFRDRDGEHHGRRHRSRSRDARRVANNSGEPNPSGAEELAPEERDARTVFCMQLSQRIRARDLEEFFSAVGKVRDVRLITCNKTRRFKGIAYIEFKDTESVHLALGLTGQKLLGVPIIVQHTQAEKNRMGNSLPNLAPKNNTGPTRLYIGSLHFNITEDMLRGIFEPFGKIDMIQLMTDAESGKSKGYGFITFHHAADAKKALEQLNGFELAGRPMKVGNVTAHLESNSGYHRFDTDELDRAGIDLSATGRLQLMFKLAEGSGLQVPQAANNLLLGAGAGLVATQPQITPPIATQCFMLNNMFDPAAESNPNWDIEIRDDVVEECIKHGGVLHVYVDKASPQGNVYVKCPTIATAVASVNSLHGRWFAGRVITAAYVPLVNYHSLFPDAMTAVIPLMLSGMRRTA